jgi:hypothetical protein
MAERKDETSVETDVDSQLLDGMMFDEDLPMPSDPNQFVSVSGFEAEDILGTNNDIEVDQSVLASQIDDIVDDTVNKVQAFDVEPTDIAEEIKADLTPGQQVFPLPDMNDEQVNKEVYESMVEAIDKLGDVHKQKLIEQGKSEEEANIARDKLKSSLYSGAYGNHSEEMESIDDVVILSNSPIAAIKKRAYDAEILKMEEEGIFGSIYGTFFGGLGEAELMDVVSAMEAGNFSVDPEFINRVNEIEKGGKSRFDAMSQAQEEFKANNKKFVDFRPLSPEEAEQRSAVPLVGSDIGQATAATGAGFIAALHAARKGTQVPGPPAVKGIASLVFGAGAFSAGFVATDSLYNIRFGEPDLDHDVPVFKTGKVAKGAYNLTKSISDALPGVARLDGYISTLPEITRASLTTAIINAAVELGLTDKIAQMPSLEAFLQSAAKDPAYSESGIDRMIAEHTLPIVHGPGMKPAIKLLRAMYHPLIRSEIEKGLQNIGLSKENSEKAVSIHKSLSTASLEALGVDASILFEDLSDVEQQRSSMIQDIAKAISSTQEVRDAFELERLQSVNRLRTKIDEEVRMRALDYSDDFLYKRFREYRDNPTPYSDFDKKVFLNDWIDSQTWATAHEDWRGEQPNVDTFKSFVRTYYAMGGVDPNSNNDPQTYELFNLVKSDADDEIIQEQLNKTPFGIVSRFTYSNKDPVWSRPSFADIEKFAVKVLEFKEEERGQKTSEIVQRGLFKRFYQPADDHGFSIFVKPDALYRLSSLLSLADTAVDEIPITTPEILQPVLENLGFPGGYWGTGAGMDKALGTGLRDTMPNYLARVRAYHKQMVGGGSVGPEEVLLAAGFDRSDPEMLTTFPNWLLGFYPYEVNTAKVISNGFRVGIRNPFRLSKNQMFKEAGGKTRSTIASMELLDGVRTDKSIDPSVRYFQAMIRLAREEIAEGRNPLRFLTRPQQDLFEDGFYIAGRDPDHGKVAVEKATRKAKNIKKMTKRAYAEVGDNELLVLRASPSYVRLKNEINRLVRANVIDSKYADQVLSMLEHQAIISARSHGTKFSNPEQVLQNTRITYNKPPGLNINPTVRVVDVDNSPLSSRPGVPKGYFEYDHRTGVSVLNFFAQGDIDSVWKMEGAFIANVMGTDFKNQIFRFFDHEYTNRGRIRLTKLGQEEFSTAWQAYRRTSDNSNGYIRRLFEELWLGITNFWSKLRRRRQVLPNELKDYWDLEFGVLPNDKRMVRALTSGAIFRRVRQAGQDIDLPPMEQARLRSRSAMAQDLGFDEPVIRKMFGDRKTKTVRMVTDEQTGQRVRVVEQRYAPRDYDALEAAVKMFALIKTNRFRKRIKSRDYVAVGSNKYHVPSAILNDVNTRVNDRLMGAFGQKWTDTKKSIFQVNRDGTNALSDPSKYPSGVTQADVNAFAARMEAMSGGMDGFEVAQRQNFFVLSNRQQGGLKTLLQEIGSQPEADAIPIQMLDPRANLKILSNAEYERIQHTLIDIEATPLNRRNRNTIDPGFLETFTKSFEDRKTFAAAGKIFRAIKGDFGRRDPLPPNAYDPGIAELFTGYGRKFAANGKELLEISKSPDFKKIDKLGAFFKSYVDSSIPRIRLDLLPKLFALTRDLDGFFEGVEARAASQQAQVLASPSAQGQTVRYGLVPNNKKTLNYIFHRIPEIQELMDGVYGMTHAERQAISLLRSVEAQMKHGPNPKKITDFSVEEQAEIVDAISVIHIALKTKDEYVKLTGEKLLKRALVYEEVADSSYNKNVGKRKVLYKNFIAYYKGDTNYLFAQPDIISRDLREKGVAGIRYSDRVAKLGMFMFPGDFKLTKGIHEIFKRELGKELPDDNIKMLSMMTMMRIDELSHELAGELAKYGYKASRRKIIGDIDLDGSISISRERYFERVRFYLKSYMRTDDWSIAKFDENGNFLEATPRSRPPTKEYGPTENKDRRFNTARAFSQLDRQAEQDAAQIIARAGIRRAKDEMAVVNIGDQQFILPKAMHDFLEDHTLNNFPKSDFKLVWGREGTGEYYLRGRVDGPIVAQLQELYAASVRAASIILSPQSFYAGLLIGTGGLPMIGYGMGVFIGGLSQLHLGKGVSAVVRDFVQGPMILGETLVGTTARSLAETDVRIPFTERFVGLPTPAREAIASLADSLQSNTSFTAGVLARLHGKRGAEPVTKPLLLPDGRVFTADEIANGVNRYGWRSAMVDAFQDPRTVMQFYDRFTKANPIYVTTAVSTLLGVGMTGASALSSGIFGLGLGYILKPGNIFSKTHKFYRESFSAIDSYLRVKVLIDELKMGKSLEEAAVTTRNIALDYSNLSDAEKSYFARYFAFYAYFSQAMKLFIDSIAENPKRVINQLKFISKTQQERTEDMPAFAALPPWDRYRANIPVKIGDEFYRLPFLLSGDTIAIIIELLGVLGLSADGTRAENAKKLVGRTSPVMGLVLKAMYEMDPVRGTTLSRSQFQVPHSIIEFDRETTGGALYDALGVEYILPSDIHLLAGTTPEGKKRVSKSRVEHPGRGVYIASNKPLYIFLFDYLQSPLTGRMGDNITALERSNLPAYEKLRDNLGDIKTSVSGDDPLLSKVGPLLALGLVKEKDPGARADLGGSLYIDPSNPTVAPDGTIELLRQNKQVTTASLDLLEAQGLAYSEGGDKFVFTDQFYPEELGRIGGVTRSPRLEKDVVMARIIRSRLSKIKEALKKEEDQLKKLRLTSDDNNQARPTSRRTPQSREVDPDTVDEAKSDLQIENEKRLERLRKRDKGEMVIEL